MTLKHLTLESTNSNGLEGASGGTGPYMLENLVVSAYNHGIHLGQSSSASSFKDLAVTSTNGTGIYLEWNANGGHTLDGVTVTGKNYGIYAAQGLASVTNVTATGQTETGIYSGDRFATSYTNVTANSTTGGRGIHIANVTNTSNAYTFSNVTATAGTSNGIHVQRSGKITMADVQVTGGTSGSGIFLDWDANGSHDLQNITAIGGIYGVYSARGGTILKNVTATAGTNSAIYLGNRYSATLDTITATASSGDRGIYIANSDGGTNTYSLTTVTVKSKGTGVDVAQSGKLTLNAVSVESSNGMGIQFGYNADGAHDLSNISIKSANIGLNAQRGLTKLADFSIETTANTGINSLSRRDQTIQRGTIKSVGSGIEVAHDAEVKFTAEDLMIETGGQYGISLAGSSSATIQRVCISGMSNSGVYANWNAKKVTILDSQFGNSGSNGGVYINSDSSYKATVTNNGFLKSTTPRAKSNSTKHNFKGNFWQGVAGGTSYTDGNVKDSATLSANPVSSCYAPSPPKLVAEYRFDECTQYSNGAGQVLDNLDSYHATPQSGLENGTSGQINRYADFSDGSRYTTVAGPNLSDWTLSVWFKTPFAPSASHPKRYYVIGSVGTRGDFLYLDRDSSGGSYRWGVYDQNNGSSDGTFRFSTLTDGWHHMVLVGSGSSTKLYIDSIYKDQVSRKTSGSVSYLGASVDDHGNSTEGQSFGTPLDELKLFNYALSASEISSIYNNEFTNKNWDGTVRSNPCSALDHIRIEAGATGLTCQRESVTFKACADSACASLYPGGDVQLTLSLSGQWYLAASGGSVLTNPQTIPIAGAVTLYLQQATVSSVSVNATTAGGPVPTGTPAVTCNNDTTTAPCEITFADAGLIFTADTNPGLEASIPTQIAGVESGPLYVRAAKSDGSGQCVSAVSGGTATLGYVCEDPIPSKCSSGSLSPTVTPSFNSNGYAGPFQFAFNDVGRIHLTASATSATGGVLNGASPGFVVKPYGFKLTGLTCSASFSGAAGFCPGGEVFTGTVSAVRYDSTQANNLGSVTSNFGKEASPQTVSFVANGMAVPSDGTAATLSAALGTFGATVNGTASGSFVWPEVGSFYIRPTMDYLGTGDMTTGGKEDSQAFAGAIGRFHPYRYILANDGSVDGNDTCDLTYFGQSFRIGFTVTPKLKDGSTTPANFAKTGYTWRPTDAAFTLVAENNDAGSNLGANILTYPGAANPTFSPSWSAGSVGTVAAADFAYTRAASHTDPLNQLKIGIAFSDNSGDKVPTNSHNMNAATAGACQLSTDAGYPCTALSLIDTQMRYGRLHLANAYGSVSPLTMSVTTQYWSGKSWVRNTIDSCTTSSGGTPQVTFSANPASGWTLTPNDFASGEMSGGLRIGRADSAFTTITATVPSWLKPDPTAQATLGIYGTSESRKTIHIRELY